MLGALVFGVRIATAQNIIVVIADDMGVDALAAYGEQPEVAPTPTLDALASQGVLFRNAWAYPVCSPFRVTAFTGLHAFEHRVGHGINSHDPERDYVLDPAQPNLASILREAGYRTAALGKWHMAAEYGLRLPDLLGELPSATESNPNDAGFDHYAGFLFGGTDYFRWPKTVDRATAWETTYATTDTANGALEALSGREPFFLWVAFTAPHIPHHEPPHELLADPSIYDFSTSGDQFRAMIEALDTELGRLFDAVDFSDTTVIFIGDNGTARSVIEPRLLYDHGKGTVYEGGLNVPLIVAGQAVPDGARGWESAALIQAADLFPTILEIAGVETPPRRDAISFLLQARYPRTLGFRGTAFSEVFVPIGGPVDPARHDRAARGERYKLIRHGISSEEFYDLALDPYEQSPLDLEGLTPEQEVAYRQLDEVLVAHTRTPVPGVGLQMLGLAAAVIAATGVAALPFGPGPGVATPRDDGKK